MLPTPAANLSAARTHGPTQEHANGPAAVLASCKYPGVGKTCQTLGYASFAGAEVSQRNLARQHLDATQWHDSSTGADQLNAIVKLSSRDASDVYEWTNTGTGSPNWITAISTNDVAEAFPSLAGVAAYVAIQVSPQQNGTAISLRLSIGTAQPQSVACSATAKQWRLCECMLPACCCIATLSLRL
jgi:hypothetical protein